MTVLGDSGQRTSCRFILWNCRCECGKETIVQTGHLMNGHTTSCGDCNEIVAGMLYGRLTPISPTGEVRYGNHTMWECRCSCGRTVVTSRNSLNSGTCQSCGCISSTYYDGFRFRSRWEVYWYIAARLRSFEVEYEPVKIAVSIDEKKRTYTPDFRIVGTQKFFEVKGRQFPIGMKKREWANAHGYDIKLVTQDELEAWCGCTVTAMSEAFSKGGGKKVKSLVKKSLRGIIGSSGNNCQLRIPLGQSLCTAA